jgi:hypothetical protein
MKLLISHDNINIYFRGQCSIIYSRDRLMHYKIAKKRISCGYRSLWQWKTKSGRVATTPNRRNRDNYKQVFIALNVTYYILFLSMLHMY